MKRNEQRATFSQLTAENRRVLRRMQRFLDSYSLNEVTQEEILTDLTGMALECQQRGQPFSEAVGMDEAVFCHELVVNCPRQTRTERVLGALRWMTAWIGCIMPVMFFLECVFPWFSGDVVEGIYYVPLPFLCRYCAAVIPVATGMYIFKRLTYCSRSLVWTLFVAVFLLVFITVSEVSVRLMNTVTVPLSLWLWLWLFGGMFAFFHVAKRCVALTVAYRQKKKL
ncbi:MAG: hypothetical protein E7552_04720 [Ruminococcaceae bacterium]|nr:hypothetical protein [Oscillospiraceae bacterium]